MRTITSAYLCGNVCQTRGDFRRIFLTAQVCRDLVARTWENQFSDSRTTKKDAASLANRFAFASRIDDKAASGERAPGVLIRPSFQEVYEQTFPFVWRTVRRLGVDESAQDDVTQEVFVAVYRRLADFEGRCSVKTWVFNILMGLVRNYRRSQRRKGMAQALSATVVDPAVLPDAGADPSEVASRAQAGRILHDLLDQLTEDKAIVFVMAELEGMTVPEIAELMNANVNTIYSRLRVARREFSVALSRMHGGAGQGGRGELPG